MERRKRLLQLLLCCVASLELCVASELCGSNPCQNDGVCVLISESDYTCQCMYGYAGELCQIDINFCDSGPCLNTGNCTDGVFTFTCECSVGFSGRQCEEDIDECQGDPCGEFGTCTDGRGLYTCACVSGYTGINCDVNIDDCNPGPCLNGSCIDGIGGYVCECDPSFAGVNCSVMTECSAEEDTCQNNGLCNVTFDGENRQTLCICLAGYTGDDCETDIDECSGNPCMNGGTCLDLTGEYSCLCPMHFTGQNCSVEIDPCDPIAVPCENSGLCIEGDCFCRNGFTGVLCEINIDDCSPSACFNDGICIDGVAGFTCLCTEQFTGEFCNISTSDVCSTSPCLNNGTCEIVSQMEYSCTCSAGFTGVNCSEMVVGQCASSPCHGSATCVDGLESFTCLCPLGFTGETCDMAIDHCSPNPCLNEGTCISQINGSSCDCLEGFTGRLCELEQCLLNCQNGGECVSDGVNTTCNCVPGFTGPLCETQFFVCDTAPCAGNSTCQPLPNDTFVCLCPEGLSGQFCEEEINECDSMSCANNGVCVDLVNGFECMCRNGFTGDMCQVNIDDCSPNPCRYNSTCVDLVANYSCECAPGYEGRNCTIDSDLCDPLPCMNGGTCTQNLTEGTVACLCVSGYQGLFCQADVDECNATSTVCMNGGECMNTRGGFNCVCPSGFSGLTCEENINDDCSNSLCMNNATCFDTGDNFECVCPPGYTGTICDLETRECDSIPCLNNGLCRDEFLNFSCVCMADYTGRVCDINLNPCSSAPCMNSGVCTNGEPGSEQFSCTCAPGFTGLLCGENIDDCESTPCLMGSSCVDSVNNFTCECADGFDGRLCDNNIINDCAFPFCLNGGSCVDIGSNYICICDIGFTGPNCEFGTNECLDNPCFNNGTCRDLFGGFECTCLPGFTGLTCETDINECTGINCNNGTCVDLTDAFICDCSPGYTGIWCETDINECADVECLFGGTCIDQVNDYRCNCVEGFQGQRCEQNINDCLMVDCGNGTCHDLVNDFYCQCVMGYTGRRCGVMINECDQQPCMNNATCVDELNNFTCVCLEGFEGAFCEADIDECINRTCLNGATCVDGIGSYTCDCAFGYEGDNCENLVDFCVSNLCANNGTCTTTGPGITECMCTQLFTGTQCEEYIDLCQDSDRCANGGECITTEQNGAPAFECDCTGPYRGNSCEIFDPCMDCPCSNNGTCVVNSTTTLGYQCLCLPPYLGPNCLYTDLCLINQPCFNGGTCINYIPSLDEVQGADDSVLPQSTTCECGPGFTGESCGVEITPCYHLPCQNGGTCLLDLTSDHGYTCQCALTWRGINCTEEINIVTPSFTGHSFLSHGLPTSDSEAEFNYSLALLTYDMSGLILYVASQSDSQNYIALGLESGQLVLDLGTESGPTELGTQVNISDNEWHIVLLAVDMQEVSLQVDSEIERVSVSRTPLSDDTLVHVGGLPDFDLLPDEVPQTMGLVGCVHDRAANGQSVELAVVDHEGRDVTQCSEPVCRYIQCQNEAECSDVAESPGFMCECLPFFSGVYCETPLPVCQPNPCLFGGQCREAQSTFSCRCPLGRAGRTCEEDLSISVPSFSGVSYITYPPTSLLPPALRTLTITLTFSPLTSSGLLFIVSTSETDFSDYFSLALVDGHVHFRYNLGSGAVFIVSETAIELAVWHTVTATLSSGRGELTVDNDAIITGSTQSIFTVLNTQNSIWLGGYTDYIDLRSVVGTSAGFTGCILSLTVNERALDLIIDADNGYDVTQCDTSSCANQPCMNGGSCIEEGPSFVCICPSGVSGTLCSRTGDRCATEQGLCADGATCVSSSDGLSFTCLCPLGRQGERCDEDVLIQSPGFNATSYLQYNPYVFGTSLSTVALSFNPVSPNGLLFYYGDSTQNRDFLSIALIERRVEYRFDLGSGPAVLISNRVNLNEWHYVVVYLDGPRGSMTVDDGIEITNNFEGLLAVLNAAGDIFVGGVSDYDTVSPHAGTEIGLTGCINGLEINGVSVDLLDDAIGGRGISECSTASCSDLTCDNGGSCQVSTGSGPMCLCVPGFAGPTCNNVIDIEVPYFAGQSYLAYVSLSNVFAMTLLTLEIRPSSPNGLLLYNQQLEGRVDYIAVLLRDGIVEFWYNLGSGVATVSSRQPVVLDEWHVIEVYRSGSSGHLIVDDMLPVTGSSSGSFTGLQLGDPLFIGGVSDIISGDLPPQIREVGGYRGCIRGVASNTVPLLLISDAIDGAGVGECPLLPCTTNPCLNNGLCFVESGNGSSDQQCLCSLPFTGDTCSERVEDFSEAMFSGQSYLEFSANALNIALQRISTSIEIAFTPASPAGLLFYIGSADGNAAMDYLYIALSDGLVELRYDLGSGEMIACTSQPLQVGRNYTLLVERNGGNGVLSVSNGDTATVERTSVATNFDYSDSSFTAYLGGAPSVASLTRGVYTSGISGCVTALAVGQVGNRQHLPLTNAMAGTAVDTCS